MIMTRSCKLFDQNNRKYLCHNFVSLLGGGVVGVRNLVWKVHNSSKTIVNYTHISNLVCDIDIATMFNEQLGKFSERFLDGNN